MSGQIGIGILTPETQVIATPDGIELFVRTYHSEQPSPSRTIYWVHGLGEHGGRYEHVARALAEKGWSTVIPDLRGHGRSTGIKTYVKSFDDYAADIALIWERLGLKSGSTVLLGHSMGGLVAIRTIQSGCVVPSSLVLSSPLLGVKIRVNPIIIFLGKLAGRVMPTLRFSNRVDPSNMTHDPTFVALRRSDPLIIKNVTAGWFVAMESALAAAHREVAKTTLPVIALQGTLDRTTDPEAMERWWKRIGSTNKELIVLGDHFHELFFEPDWPTTVKQILDWLEAKEQR